MFGWFRCCRQVYSEMVLLELVGLVIRISLCGLLMVCSSVFCWVGLQLRLLIDKVVWVVLRMCSMIFLLNCVGSVEMWKLMVCVFSVKCILLFWGRCFLVIFSCVRIFRCVVSLLCKFSGGCVSLCSMLFRCKCMWKRCLKGLKCRLEVFMLIVLVSSLCSRCIMGMLLLVMVVLEVCSMGDFVQGCCCRVMYREGKFFMCGGCLKSGLVVCVG